MLGNPIETPPPPFKRVQGSIHPPPSFFSHKAKVSGRNSWIEIDLPQTGDTLVNPPTIQYAYLVGFRDSYYQ